MKVILFGATGMVGQGVLRECLLDPEVTSVLAIGRSASGLKHEKLHQLAHSDFGDFSTIENQLAGYDACFFCLGVSSAGMKEADYHHVTYDYTLAAAQTLARLNPNLTFIYVSGAGTDSSEKGRAMWARVKGKTENALLQLPFKAKYMFRPGIIQPKNGIISKTKLYRILYLLMAPLFPLMRLISPSFVTNTEKVGRAMLLVTKQGAPSPIIENRDINRLTQP